jgi:hypothetical protein
MSIESGAVSSTTCESPCPRSRGQGQRETHRVIPDFKVLDFDTSFLGDSPEEEGGRCVTGVSLVGVRLDHHTLIHTRRMTRFILALVVRVDLSINTQPYSSSTSRTGDVDIRHDPHPPRSRNYWRGADGTRSCCNLAKRRYVPRMKEGGWIRLLGKRHSRLLRYRRE